MSNKTVVIGLDGATFDLIRPWSEAGYLPHFRTLLRDGTHSVLRSTIPPTTLPAWTSFATGKSPGKHGCYDFRMPTDSLERNRFVTSNDIPGKTFYELLVEAGEEVTLINLPVSYPPRVGETVITSLMTQGTSCVFPPTLIQEIPNLETYQIVAETRTPAAIEMVERERFSVARKLFDREWDFFFLLFSGSDHISHEMYAEMQEGGSSSKGSQLFQDLDRYLGWFMEHLPREANLLVMSDHGFKVFSTIFYINSWLVGEGYLALGGGVRPEGEDLLSKMRDQGEPDGQEPQLDLSRLSRLFFQHPWLYRLGKRLYHGLRSVLPLDLRLQSQGADLSRSVAYAATNECKGVYINDSVRFRDGIVDPQDIAALREEIIVKLEALTDPTTGQDAFARVWRKEELYDGGHLRFAPDIVLEPNVFVSFLLRSAEPFESTMVNYHSREGIFLAWGADIAEGVTLDNAKIEDLAPTILHLMGLPVPEDVDGRVLLEILEPGSEPADRPVRFREGTGPDTFTPDGEVDKDEETVRDRLRALGYWA